MFEPLGEMGYNNRAVPWKKPEEMENNAGLDAGDTKKAILVLDDVLPYVLRKASQANGSASGEVLGAAVKALGSNAQASLIKDLGPLDLSMQPKRVQAALQHVKQNYPKLYDQINFRKSSTGFPMAMEKNIYLPSDMSGWKSVINQFGQNDTMQALQETMKRHKLDMFGMSYGDISELLTLHEVGHTISWGGFAAKRAGKYAGIDDVDLNQARLYRQAPQEAYADAFAAREFKRIRGLNIGNVKPPQGNHSWDMAALGAGEGVEHSDAALKVAAYVENAIDKSAPFLGRYGKGGLIGAGVVGGLALAHNMFTDDQFDYNKTKAASVGAGLGIAVTAGHAVLKDHEVAKQEWDMFSEIAGDMASKTRNAAKKGWRSAISAGNNTKLGKAMLAALRNAASAR